MARLRSRLVAVGVCSRSLSSCCCPCRIFRASTREQGGDDLSPAPVDLSSILVHVSLSVNVAESRLRTALRLCGERRNLRRTVPIALVVGAVLTLINQGDVFLDGGSTVLTWVKLGLNFCVPFIVSNLGLLTGCHGSTREGPGDP